jgi:peroxiredoxin
MPALETPACVPGTPAPDFSLPDPQGVEHCRESCRGARGLLVMFLCNHCPFVQAVLPRLVPQVADLAEHGIGAVAIMSNDYQAYPADAPAQMRRLADKMQFGFPYLIDRSQTVARRFGAVCTPDFFGYNAAGLLQYRGRLDAARLEPPSPGTRSELHVAMLQVARTGSGPAEQWPSIGCSIKWREP